MKGKDTCFKIMILVLVFFIPGFLCGHQEYYQQKGEQEVPSERVPIPELISGGKGTVPPGWEFTNTGVMNGILIPHYAIVSVYGNEPGIGSWLGVFYTDEYGVEKCGGARQYSPNQSMILVAYGNDPFTPLKDGFSNGEKFMWRIFENEIMVEYPAIPTYDPNASNPNGTFGNGVCEILKLEAVLNLQFNMKGGWNGFSLPFTPIVQDVPAIFDEIVDQLIILQNYEYVFWPEENINTFPYWLSSFGAQIKISADASMEVSGIPGVRSIDLAEGWSYLPVLSLCNVDVIGLFLPITEKIDVVKSIAETTLYWPAMGINTLGELETGKAYMIKLNQPATIIFPDCSQSVR